MPTPPYNSNKSGVSDFCSTEPSVYITYNAMSGPIALDTSLPVIDNKNLK